MLNNPLNTENSFLKTSCVLVLIIVLHFTTLTINSEWPWGLLYGPALFYAHVNIEHKRNAKRTFFILSIPFFLFAMYYIFLAIEGKSIERFYSPVYRLVLAVFFMGFPSVILARKNRWKQPVDHLKSLLILQLSAISIVIGVLTAVLLADHYFEYAIEFDGSPMYIVPMLLALSGVLLTRYNYQEWRWKKNVHSAERTPIERLSTNEPRHSLSRELLEEYAERVHQCLETNQLYLRCGLSIELLSEETQITRHHLSELFRSYYGKNFYGVIAEYRIKRAIRLMETSDQLLTIEAMAYECGFSSKTTFNKYFKEITGCLPSEFEGLEVV